MYTKNFVAANDGNISCKVDHDIIWTTPTGVSKGFMDDGMLVKMRLDGTVLAGSLKPSSEVKMHIRIYLENPEVMGVTHAHPPICTSFAIAGIGLDRAVYPEALVNLGTVPCIHYETPGTQGIPDSVAPYCRDYNAVLLGNHGALSWGKSLIEAFYRLESMEHYAMVLMYTGNIIGKANVLSCDQVSELLDIRKSLGITAGGVPPCAAEPTNLRDVVAPHSAMECQGEARDEIRTYVPACTACGSGGGVSDAKPAGAPELSGREDFDPITKAVLERLRAYM
jgi:L-fuculose-phosphate aldolase